MMFTDGLVAYRGAILLLLLHLSLPVLSLYSELSGEYLEAGLTPFMLRLTDYCCFVTNFEQRYLPS
jgi:hypothetical protein